jgi:hypothetical protein
MMKHLIGMASALVLGSALVIEQPALAYGLVDDRVVDRPVMVGGDPEGDACGALGEVRGLKPGGDGFLALRSGPSANARMIDKLQEGDAVYMCDDVPGWIGVVVYPSNPMISCDVTYPITPKQPYSGRCKAGWVSDKFIELVAG